MSNLFQYLNPEQYQGVIHNTGPLLILAGAGSGKTRVITTRIANLISNKSIKPNRILALTFTNKAAKEMKERVVKLLPKYPLKGLRIGTFHSFGVFILKKHIDLLGYRKKFSIFNAGDKIQLITNIMKDLKIDIESVKPESVGWRISGAKNNLLKPEQTGSYFSDSLLTEVYSYYQTTLKGFNILDFDDLLMLTVELFNNNEDLAQKYSNKYKYMMVDEYQDTNKAQYEMLKCLTCLHSNICVVGDDDQSIYAWRGADISNILNFENDFPGTKTIRLEQNYRSTRNIIDAANSLIEKNMDRKGKKLWTSGEKGEQINVLSNLDESDEAENVLNQILDLRRDRNLQYSDFAVVFRTNFQTRPFEEHFTSHGVPYDVIGGTKFFDRKEVKDIVSYLRLLANRQDELALLRIINKPKRGIGPQTIEKIINYSKKHDLTLFQVLEDVDRVKGIEPHIAHNIYVFYELIEEFSKKIFKKGSMVPVIKELIQAIAYEDELLKDAGGDSTKYQRSLKYLQGVVNSVAIFEHDEDIEEHDLFSYLERIALLSNDDKTDEKEKKSNAVTLLTMHSCKGLEFPYVFICGVEEGNIPHQKSIEEGEDKVQEERRLFYVGMTRAMKGLVLSFSESRYRYGEVETCNPSRFLEEIEPEFLNFIDTEEQNELNEDDLMSELKKMQDKYK